jgi:CBS domain containing-hemolysin-like protein
LIALRFFLIVLFIGVTGFFSGIETGAYRINRTRLRLLAANGMSAAKSVQTLLQDMPQLVALTLIAQNISVDIASGLTTALCKSLLTWNPELVATVALAPVFLVSSEIIPKELFRRRADALMLWSEKPLWLWAKLCSPLLRVAQTLASPITRAFVGKVTSRGDAAFHPLLLAELIEESVESGEIDRFQHAMTKRLVVFLNLEVARAMQPSRKVVMISDRAGAETVERLIQTHPYSRFPVYSKTPSRIVGVMNALDFLCERDSKKPADIAWEPVFIEKSNTVADALYTLQQAKRPMGIVVQSLKSKEAVGIVTVKDLVEEVVGELAAW